MTQGWAVPEASVAPDRLQCEVCYHRGPNNGGRRDGVTACVIRWRDPLPGREFSDGRRCVDHLACRGRCEAFGDPWPIEDGTPPTMRPARSPVPERAATVEPAGDEVGRSRAEGAAEPSAAVPDDLDWSAP